MSRIATLALIVGAAAAAAGCLQKTTRHVLYLAPDGSLTWTTTESDIHSDEKDLVSRRAEEEAYLSAAHAGTHRVAQALAALGPSHSVRTQIVRSERPFTVVTEARFDAVDRLLQRLFTENGLQALAAVHRTATSSTLHVRLDFGSSVEVESPAAVLLEDFEHLSLVLTAGTFVDSDGFSLSANGRRATIAPQWLERAGTAGEANGTIELWITWSLE